MTTTLRHPDALVRIEDTKDNKRKISIEAKPRIYVHRRTWETSYSLELIDHVLRVKGPSYLCDEIRREEDADYVERNLHWAINSYVCSDAFSRKRILDFGSGSGASSIVLARMFPNAEEIVGVELEPSFIQLAEHRARFYSQQDRVSFHLSPTPDSLPSGIGNFDYILFSAVYEHLLPRERGVVLPLVWSHLSPNGVLFLDETPYRWFPVEGHTTRLPLINYLPDRLALSYARRFSRRVRPDESWNELLRRGIRGGTTKEIVRILHREGYSAELLRPSLLGVGDNIDLWYRLSGDSGRRRMKMLMRTVFKMVGAATGHTFVPSLSLAILNTAQPFAGTDATTGRRNARDGSAAPLTPRPLCA